MNKQINKRCGGWHCRPGGGRARHGPEAGYQKE